MQSALTWLSNITICTLQSKYKAVRFACQQRSSLLTMLFESMAAAAAEGTCSIAAKMLG